VLVIEDNLCNNYCNISLNRTCRDFLYKWTSSHMYGGGRKWTKKRTITKKLVHSQNSKPIQPAAHPHLKKKSRRARKPFATPSRRTQGPPPADTLPFFSLTRFPLNWPKSRSPSSLLKKHLLLPSQPPASPSISPSQPLTPKDTRPQHQHSLLPDSSLFPFVFIFPSRQPKLSFPLSPKTNPKPAIFSY